MAKYRKEIEAIAYTGDNVEEIKEMLGDCYIGIDMDKRIWYEPTKDCGYRFYLRPSVDILVKEGTEFWDDITKELLKEYELVE